MLKKIIRTPSRVRIILIQNLSSIPQFHGIVEYVLCFTKNYSKVLGANYTRGHCAMHTWILFPLFWPFALMQLFLISHLVIHELGHLVAALLTGQKVTKVRIGLLEPPALQFNFYNIDFGFSGDGNGGKVYIDLWEDDSGFVRQMSILFTALAGPFANFMFASALFMAGVLFFHAGGAIQEIVGFGFLVFATVEFFMGLEGIFHDVKNIIKK